MWSRWAHLADTKLRLAHFHHHRPHKGARKHRVGEATPEATARPNRAPRDRNAAGLSHRNPVAKAMGKASTLSSEFQELHGVRLHVALLP